MWLAVRRSLHTSVWISLSGPSTERHDHPAGVTCCLFSPTQNTNSDTYTSCKRSKPGQQTQKRNKTSVLRLRAERCSAVRRTTAAQSLVLVFMRQDVSADKNQMKAVCVRLELLLCGRRRVSAGTRRPPAPPLC